ncbi:TnsD family Tn7-like transposition protein [Pseudoalteromonas phenolica]|uniref:TnsD family Tn7-like transposition protein n=1 Tax=Pseudoalteromonas phenolica TaxID=161398 RepID=UPI00384EB9B4
MPGFSYSQYLEGESIYGLLTNYHVASGNRSWKQTNLDIFGRTHVRLHSVLPNNINAIAQFFNVDPVYLLTHATGYPLYAFSLSNQASKLKKVLLSPKGQLIASYSRQAPSSLALAKQHRYCPKCIGESFDKLGKLSWRIEHQLYGVSHCPEHDEPLFYLSSGEGGINRQYYLPAGGEPILIGKNDKAAYLSGFVAKLYHELQSDIRFHNTANLYSEWLMTKGFLTKCGNIRMRFLVDELVNYWKELFEATENLIPLELSNFSYVADIIHDRRPVHYLKHVLLMAYLAKSPHEFFALSKTPKPVSEPLSQENSDLESNVFKLLDNASSLRTVSANLGVSVGYVKQLALRNNYKVDRRRWKLTDEIERDVWRKAFVGWHRVDIAKHHGLSVGTIEQLIQSHQGLSNWRHHMVMAKRKAENRSDLIQAIEKNPQITRNELKRTFSCYMWLYKNDREWLYQNLPSPQSKKYYPSVDWAARDKFLAIKVKFLQGEFKSLSELDRALGGHGWLLHDAKNLPLTMEVALLRVDSK